MTVRELWLRLRGCYNRYFITIDYKDVERNYNYKHTYLTSNYTTALMYLKSPQSRPSTLQEIQEYIDDHSPKRTNKNALYYYRRLDEKGKLEHSPLVFQYPAAFNDPDLFVELGGVICADCAEQ